MNNFRQLTEQNRSHLKEFHDSVKGFIAIGRRTNITCPNSGRLLCKNIQLFDLEVDIDKYTFYKVGQEIEHAYIDPDILWGGDSFMCYVSVKEYKRQDGTTSFGLEELPTILELQLILKLSIVEANKPISKAQRIEHKKNIENLLTLIAQCQEEATGLDKLALYHLEADLLTLGLLTVQSLEQSIKRSKKKIKRNKSKGFGQSLSFVY